MAFFVTFILYLYININIIMKQLFCLLTISLSCFSFAQAGNENVSFSTGNFFTRANRSITKEYVVDGTPYTTGKDFSKVNIAGYSKNVQKLRYNAYEDEMEFSQDNETYFTNKEAGLEINFPDINKTYICLNYRLDDKTKLGYLQLLKKGPKYSLLKREKIELLKGEKSPSAYGKDANDYYAKEKDVYIISNDNKYYRVPKNNKDLSQISITNQANVLEFVKNNKINLSKETDLIKLIDFMNSN